MNLCADNHDEICYEGRRCPCCDVIEDKKSLEKDVEELQRKLNELGEERDQLESKVAELEKITDALP